ncbi:hypothetical protein MLD38_020669 [Melastoma candidum]|uniref:Uncharacterized protein n=1 Tax=Melastoma candidum TaxID=119954 RepID=A0ACB9QLR5_9MYRT|nr:hypothetical protein MLD38_020669 [Melastoma candidum]
MSAPLLPLNTASFPKPCPSHFPARRRSSAAPAVSAAPPRWDSNAEPIPRGRFYGLDLDGDGGTGFVFDGGSKENKKRVWWSDVDGGEAEGEVEEEEFDSAEEEFWGFKLLAAFGWMVPAVGISLLLGTGPNAFIMALAVPLGQRLISLAFEKAVGMAGDASRPRYRPTKTRRKPYPKAKAKTDVKKVNPNERRGSGSGGERNGYRSWAAADASYRSAGGEEKKSKYGGWDDLDDISRASKVGANAAPPRRDDSGPFRQQRRKNKSSNRVGRANETPLLMRLLIAAFPFLGFWTRLF